MRKVKQIVPLRNQEGVLYLFPCHVRRNILTTLYFVRLTMSNHLPLLNYLTTWYFFLSVMLFVEEIVVYLTLNYLYNLVLISSCDVVCRRKCYVFGSKLSFKIGGTSVFFSSNLIVLLFVM